MPVSVAWRDAVFGQYDLHNNAQAFMRMIRTAEWKLVRYYFTSFIDALYNLKDDPGETNNLYGQPAYRAVRDELQERLTAWMRSVDDPILRCSDRSVGSAGCEMYPPQAL